MILMARGRYIIDIVSNYPVARINSKFDDEKADQLVKMFAAAADVLDVLKAMVRRQTADYPDSRDPLLDAARDAIAKSEVAK